jgi:hypothetical protein
MRNVAIVLTLAFIILLIVPQASFGQFFGIPLPVGQGSPINQLFGGLFAAAGDTNDADMTSMLSNFQQLLKSAAVNGQISGGLGDISGLLIDPSQQSNLQIPDLGSIVDQVVGDDTPLDIDALKNMIPDDLRGTAEQSLEQFGDGFDPSMLEGIDPNMLNGVDLGMLGGIDQSMLGNIDSAILQQLLQSGGFDALLGSGVDFGALLGGGGDLSGIDLSGLMQMLGGIGQGDLSGLFDGE